MMDAYRDLEFDMDNRLQRVNAIAEMSFSTLSHKKLKSRNNNGYKPQNTQVAAKLPNILDDYSSLFIKNKVLLSVSHTKPKEGGKKQKKRKGLSSKRFI